MDGNSTSTVTKTNSTQINFVAYKERWFLVLLVSLMQITNGALWINYASIANFTSAYYGISFDAVNWLSMSYFVTYGPVAFLAMWIIDEYGLKYGMYLACFFNVVGCVVRLLGTANFIPVADRYAVTLTGQTLASIALPMLMAMPTKISQDWFPENERTTSTTICVMTSPVGSALGAFIPSFIVFSKNDMPLMNYIFCGCGIAAGVLGVLVRSSKPPTPPSATARQLQETNIRRKYIPELIDTLKNGRFVMYAITSGSVMIAIPSALTSVMQQMFCEWGYTDNLAGICSGLMIGCSVPFSALITFIAEKTKCYEELMKTILGLEVVVSAVFFFTMGVSYSDYFLPILSALASASMGIIPICLEIAVEDTYPTDESITSSLIVFSGQIQAAIYVPLMTLLNRPLSKEQMRIQRCIVEGSSEAFDMTYSKLLIICISAFCTLCIIVLYRPKYKRMEAEQKEKLKIGQSIQNESNVIEKTRF